MIIKSFDQFREGEDLTVVLRAPSEKCNKVYDCFCHKSLLQKILIGRMSGTFGQLLMLFVCDQRTVYIDRNIPSECFVNTVVFRCRRKILVSSDYMCDSHKVVVYNVCKIVSRVSVGFDQDQILHLLVIYSDITIDNIMESGGSFCRHVETDNMRFACIKTLLHFFFGQVQTSLVIDGNFLTCNNTFHGFQFFRSAEAIISISLLDKLFCIFQIKAGCLSLTLYIWSDTTVLVRSFIMNKSGVFHGTVDDIDCTFHITLLVGILNTEDKISVLVFCNKICIECCTKIADVHSSCRARCKSGSDFCHRSFLPFKM